MCLITEGMISGLEDEQKLSKLKNRKDIGKAMNTASMICGEIWSDLMYKRLESQKEKRGGKKQKQNKQTKKKEKKKKKKKT